VEYGQENIVMYITYSSSLSIFIKQLNINMHTYVRFCCSCK